MAENYIDAENDYMLGMKYKDIADKYGVTMNTVKSWKQRYGWERGKGCKKSVRTKKEKVCTQRKKGAHIPDEQKEVTEPDDGLTDNQRLFCLYYVKYRNKVKAYQKAYRCSYETACGNASNTFKNIEIQQEINRIMAEIREDIRIDILDLIQQQIDIARADITDFVDLSGGMVRLESDIDGTLIKEVKDTKEGIAIKLYDKQKAIDFLVDNLPEGTGEEQGNSINTLVDIVMNSRPNRNLEDFE